MTNVGRRDRLADAEPGADALGQRRLARTQRTDEDDEVAGAQHVGERPAERVGVLRGRQHVLRGSRHAPGDGDEVGQQRRREAPRSGRSGWRPTGGRWPRRRGRRRGADGPAPRPSTVRGPRNHFAADSPSATTTGGSSSSSWRCSQPLQRATSGAFGVRLAGGRHFTTLRTAHSARSRPASAEELVEQRAGPPHERPAGLVLGGAGRLARRTRRAGGRRPARRRRRRAAGRRRARGRRRRSGRSRPAWPSRARRRRCGRPRRRRRPAGADEGLPRRHPNREPRIHFRRAAPGGTVLARPQPNSATAKGRP